MTRAAVAILLLSGVLACGHKKPEEPRPEPAPQPQGRPPERRAPPEDEGRVPVTSSPEGVLLPGALQRIQRVLADRGFLTGRFEPGELDRPTREALRAFQRSEGLAATGFPDDVTVTKMGLDPKEVFRGEQEQSGSE